MMTPSRGFSQRRTRRGKGGIDNSDDETGLGFKKTRTSQNKMTSLKTMSRGHEREADSADVTQSAPFNYKF